MDLLTRLVEEMDQFPETTENDILVKRELIEDMKAAIPIRIQNVADYLYLESGQETFSLRGDCPNVAPPWPVFFMSYKRRPRIRIRDEWRTAESPPGEIGFLFSSDLDEASGEWTVYSFAFEGHAARGFNWSIDKDGHFAAPADKRAKKEAIAYAASPIVRWPQLEILDSRPPDLEPFIVPFLAISFCHCKNVDLVREPVAPKVKAKRDRVHSWSPESWHTLRIEPIRTQLNAAGAREPGGLKRALHIMRGHFKDYREGRGLFGKTHGLWWWNFRLIDSVHNHRYNIGTTTVNE